MFPLRWWKLLLELQLDPTDLLQTCRWNSFSFNFDGVPVGRKVKFLSLNIYRTTSWEQIASIAGFSQNWFGAGEGFKERAKPPSVTAQSRREEIHKAGTYSLAVLYSDANKNIILEGLCCLEHAELKIPCWMAYLRMRKTWRNLKYE